MKSNWLLLIIIIGIASCKSEIDTKPRQTGPEYFNNKLGSWIIYKVDSIVFNDFHAPQQGIDTFRYQIKEVISEKFVNASGNETNRIERFKRNNDTLPWVITNVWTSNLLASSVEKVEENIRYVKLSFPVSASKFWAGNQFNSLEAWEYSYRNIKTPITLNGFTFSNTITVLQKDSADDNFIEKRFAKEVYAENIGMVYKQLDTLETQNFIKKGLNYRQTAIDWSK